MENLLFEDTYLKSLTFDELMDFIIENGNLVLFNEFLITFRHINVVEEGKLPVIILIDCKTVNHDVFVKRSNKIFRFNKDDFSMEYVCNENSPFLNTVFKGD